jgi:membrane-associated protease RseP (regulator of RpoE activity)
MSRSGRSRLPLAAIPAVTLLAVVLAGVVPPTRMPAHAASGARGDLGAVFAELTPEVRAATGWAGPGAYVIDVIPDGPADLKGLEEGDVVVEFESEPVRSAAQLAGRIRRAGAGRMVSLHVFRDGSKQWLGLVTLATRPEVAAATDEVVQLRAEVEQLWTVVDSLERRIRKLEGGPARKPKR